MARNGTQVRACCEDQQPTAADAFALWVRRIVHHAALLDLLRQRRHPLLSLDDLGEPSTRDVMAGYPAHSGSARDYDDLLTRLDMDHRLGTLPALYKQSLRLLFIEGMSQDEVEQALERPRSTVATQIEQGLKRLRPALRNFQNLLDFETKRGGPTVFAVVGGSERSTAAFPRQPLSAGRSRAAPTLHWTARGREVLKSFCDTNDEIADLLEVAESTVETHVRNLFHKLRVKSRPFAVGRALRLGLCLPFRNPPRTSRWPRHRPYLLPYGGGGISLFWKSSALKVQRRGL